MITLTDKDNKPSPNNFGSFVNLSRKKKRQKIIFGFLAAVLGVGLVGSSMFWAFDGSNLPSKANSGDVQQQTSNIDQQIADMEAQIKGDQQNIALLDQLAKLYIENGDMQKAVDTYIKALKIKPGDADMHKELGKTYFLKGNYNQAVVQLQQAIELKPEDAYAHYYVGQIYAFRTDEGRNIVEGIKELKEFIRIQKEGPDVEKAKQYIDELQAGQTN